MVEIENRQYKVNKETANKILNTLGVIPFIEIIQILNGLRLSCRISTTLVKEKFINETVGSLGLYYIRSKHAILNTDNFSHNKSFQLESNDSLDYYYYIGINEAVSSLAYLSEGTNTSRQGALFGYPDCCINFFGTKYKTGLNDLTYEIDRSANNYIFWNNRITKCIGYCLISHFPCSWDCMATQLIAKQTYSYLREIVPHIADKCLNLQQQNLFYSTDHIVFPDKCLSVKLNSIEKSLKYKINDENKLINIDNEIYSKYEGRIILMDSYIFLPFNDK